MIVLVLLFGLAFRLIALNQSLWLDEAINVVNAKNLNLVDFVTKYPVGDFHPPLYFAILWIWGHFFGFSEISIRLPSVVLGIATIWLVYLVGKDLFSKKVGLIGALLLSVAPLHIYYSQEARMYSLATFTTALSFYFLIRLVHGKSLVSYILSLILLLYSDYLIYLILPSQTLFILWSDRTLLKKVVLSQVISLISLTPWLPVFNQQLQAGKEAAILLPNWAQVVGGGTIKNMGLLFTKTIIGRISFDNKLVYGLTVAAPGIVYGFLFLRAARKLTWQIKLLLCWIVLPIVLALLISVFIPVFSYFRMIFILPAFYLVIALGLESLPKKYFKLALGALLLASLFFLGVFYINPKFQREDWRAAVNTIENVADEKSFVIFEDNNVPAPYQYYSTNKVKLMPGLLKVPAKSLHDIVDLKGINKIYLFEYLVDVTDTDRFLQKKILEDGFREIKIYDFNGVGFVHNLNR